VNQRFGCGIGGAAAEAVRVTVRVPEMSSTPEFPTTQDLQLAPSHAVIANALRGVNPAGLSWPTLVYLWRCQPERPVGYSR
jgi:hypothetical protein